MHIGIYDDRMEIYSPGGMYDGSLVQNFDTNHVPSMRRNLIIADIFSRMNYMERRGSGFKKIKDAYHAEINYRPEVEPKFYSDNSSLWVTLHNLNYKVPVDKVMVKNSKVLVESEKVAIRDKKVAIEKNKVVFEKNKIIRLFSKYGVESIIGRTDIVQVTGDSLTAAGNLINKMKEAGIIEPVRGYGKGKYRFEVWRLFCDNITIAKILKTLDTRCIPSKKLPKMPYKSSEITLISHTKLREGGKTVGSGRVATIIEKLI